MHTETLTNLWFSIPRGDPVIGFTHAIDSTPIDEVLGVRLERRREEVKQLVHGLASIAQSAIV